MSTSEKEWITKFEILVYDANEIDELFKEFKISIAINERCLHIEQDKIEVVEFPADDRNGVFSDPKSEQDWFPSTNLKYICSYCMNGFSSLDLS